MKILPLVACGLILGVLAVCELASPAADAPAASVQPGPAGPLEVPGGALQLGSPAGKSLHPRSCVPSSRCWWARATG